MKGIVARVTGSWHDIRLEDGSILPSRIIGKLRMDDIKTTNPVGVGDEVEVQYEAGDEVKGVITEVLPRRKLQWLVLAGVLALLVGWLLGVAGICPVVKRIWTPAWTLYSGGWCLLLLAFFYWVMDMRKIQRWAFPLVVIGMNSIAAYVIAHICEHFVSSALRTHLGADAFEVFGKPYDSLLHGGAILAVFWLILFWMYRRKVFLRI